MAEVAEKYEDKLFGKIDFLHEKSKQTHNSLIIFSNIITKFMNIISEFSKSIDNIKNRKVKIINDKNSTMYNLTHYFKLNLKAHIDEFKECAEHLNITIIGPIIQTIEEKYIKEKELYNNYCKIKNIYNNAKINLEKAKKEFDNNAKICEKNILNLVQLKSMNIINAGNVQDINKIEERNKLSIATAKNFEDKYFQCLEEANKARENEINKHKELLSYYQVIDTDFYSKISLMISYIVPLVKKMYLSILKSLEGLEDHCKKVKIQQDINNFIKDNQSELKPDEKIQFIPYYPEATLELSSISGNDKKDLENLDINYNVILTLHENFRDIRKDLDMEEEKKKFRLRFLCSKIFKIGPGVGFKKEEKEELISLLKDKTHKSYFLITLSKQRTKGRFQRSETLLKDLSEILHNILEDAEKEKSYEDAKNCLILSQTFYMEVKKGKNKKKKYLFDLIKGYNWLNSLDFWEGIIEYMIQKEIEKNNEINEKNKYVEDEEQIKTRINNIAFSQVLSYSNSMIEFLINKDDIIKVVDKFVKKYEIEKSMAEAIYDNIKNTSYPPEDSDDNEEENKNNINKRPKSQSVIVKAEDTRKTDKRSKSFKEKDNNINKEGQKENNNEKNKINDKDLKNEEKKEDNKIEEKKEDNIKEEKKEENIKEEKKEDNIKEEKNENNIKEEKNENNIKEEKNENNIKEEKNDNSIKEEKKEDNIKEEKKEEKSENDRKEQNDKIQEENKSEENDKKEIKDKNKDEENINNDK